MLPPSIVHGPYGCILVPPISSAIISPSSSGESITAGTKINKYTKRWLALKNALFYTVDGTEGSLQPSPGSVLRLSDSSERFFTFSGQAVSSIYIRECYTTWFNFFLDGVAKQPHGRFALSSTPGCGKTFAVNFILKMITTTSLLQGKEILYQLQSAFYLFRLDNVTRINKKDAERIALETNTFYILDGHGADAITTAECLTLFISCPRSDSFKHWYFHAMVIPRYFPVWSLEELRSCRKLCYPTLDAKTIDDRYQQYGGVARYVLWYPDDPSDIMATISDARY